MLPKEGTTLFQTGYLNLRFPFYMIVDSFCPFASLGRHCHFHSVSATYSAPTRVLSHTFLHLSRLVSHSGRQKRLRHLTVILQLPSHQLLRIVTLSNSCRFPGLDEIRSLLAQYCCEPLSPYAHSITGLLFCRRSSMRNASQ